MLIRLGLRGSLKVRLIEAGRRGTTQAAPVLTPPVQFAEHAPPIPKEDYIRWTLMHLGDRAKAIERAKLVEVEKAAWKYLNRLSNKLSKSEYNAIKQSIKSKAIPSPQLLVKDHKPKVNGEYETRLVIPATNFTAAFPKAGYLGIKAILDENNVN